MRLSFLRRGRHALGAAVTGIPSAPLSPPPAVRAPEARAGRPLDEPVPEYLALLREHAASHPGPLVPAVAHAADRRAAEVPAPAAGLAAEVPGDPPLALDLPALDLPALDTSTADAPPVRPAEHLAEEPSVDELLAGHLLADELLADELPAEQLPAEELAAEEVPAEELPAEELPAEELPVDDAPPPVDELAGLDELPAVDEPEPSYVLELPAPMPPLVLPSLADSPFTLTLPDADADHGSPQQEAGPAPTYGPAIEPLSLQLPALQPPALQPPALSGQEAPAPGGLAELSDLIGPPMTFGATAPALPAGPRVALPGDEADPAAEDVLALEALPADGYDED